MALSERDYMALRDHKYFDYPPKRKARGAGLRALLARVGIGAIALCGSYVAYLSYADKATELMRRHLSAPRLSLGSANEGQATPFPLTGDAIWYVSAEPGQQAPLKITAPAGDAHFAVLLTDWETRKPVVLIPIQQGEAADGRVPLGRYRVTILSGTTWYGPPAYFGRAMVAEEVLRPIDLYRRPDGGVTGHTISLERRIDGNMPTRPVRMP